MTDDSKRMLSRAKRLKIGESFRWENAPLSCGMIAEYLNDGFCQYAVLWVCTNWEASLGYTFIQRTA